jgi:hypothetical protein
MSDSDQQSGEWYRCPYTSCGAEYRSEHARDLCAASHGVRDR